jgi:hypothetical protein
MPEPRDGIELYSLRAVGGMQNENGAEIFKDLCFIFCFVGSSCKGWF